MCIRDRVETGGNIATYFQIAEPVNPMTVFTPSRAAEEMKLTARTAARLGVKTVIGFTGSAIWKYVAMFPPVSTELIDAGYRDFAGRWNPILDVFDEVGVRFAHEVHPSEIAYDYWTTVRTLEAIGHREAFGLN